MKKFIYSIIVFLLVFTINYYYDDIVDFLKESYALNTISYDLSEIPVYDGVNDYIIINNNNPKFTLEEMNNTSSFEEYSDLDFLGRCGTAFANIGYDLMPTKEREGIGAVRPSGFKTIKYDIISGKYLYNRCHLIGYQLTGENANVKNLITCTRQMNTKSMLEFEDKVSNYIKKTHNHVLYRVTPIFEGSNLISSGVTIEAYSVEDHGKGIKFYIYIYNVQDHIEIDYKTGDSKLIN